MSISDKDNQRLNELAQRYPHLFRGVILPWFTSDSWPRMRSAAADGDRLHDTFEEFERTSNIKVNELTAQSHPVEKVEIDVEALIAWCKAEGRPLNGMARQTFAIMTLVERDKGAGHA